MTTCTVLANCPVAMPRGWLYWEPHVLAAGIAGHSARFRRLINKIVILAADETDIGVARGIDAEAEAAVAAVQVMVRFCL
jgi:hypothetical protein